MNYKEKIKKIALNSPDKEVCGYLIMDRNKKLIVFECKNYAQNPSEDFFIDPADYLKAKSKGEILLCFHSHPKTIERPTTSDINSSENSKIPFLIYSVFTDNFFLFTPESYKIKPFIGREYIEDVQQCTSIVVDFYCKWKKLPRNYFYENGIIKKSISIINEIIDLHFIKVDQKDIKYGDLLQFKILTSSYSHFGIYLSDENFLHQPDKGLSNTEFLNYSWRRRLCNIYRLKEL